MFTSRTQAGPRKDRRPHHVPSKIPAANTPAPSPGIERISSTGHRVRRRVVELPRLGRAPRSAAGPQGCSPFDKYGRDPRRPERVAARRRRQPRGRGPPLDYRQNATRRSACGSARASAACTASGSIAPTRPATTASSSRQEGPGPTRGPDTARDYAGRGREAAPSAFEGSSACRRQPSGVGDCRRAEPPGSLLQGVWVGAARARQIGSAPYPNMSSPGRSLVDSRPTRPPYRCSPAAGLGRRSTAAVAGRPLAALDSDHATR